MLIRREGFETYLRTGWQPGAAPNSGVALQLKFNPNRDPSDGRFTFGSGSGVAGNSQAEDEIVVTARRRKAAPLRKPKAPKTLFPDHVGRNDIDGEVARKLNRLVNDPNAVESIRLGGTDMTISRTGKDTVSLTAHGGDFTANGRFVVAKDGQGMAIAIDHPALHGAARLGSITSFPGRITIGPGRPSGRLIYSIDKAAAAHFPILGSPKQAAGNYHFTK